VCYSTDLNQTVHWFMQQALAKPPTAQPPHVRRAPLPLSHFRFLDGASAARPSSLAEKKATRPGLSPALALTDKKWQSTAPLAFAPARACQLGPASNHRCGKVTLRREASPLVLPCPKPSTGLYESLPVCSPKAHLGAEPSSTRGCPSHRSKGASRKGLIRSFRLPPRRIIAPAANPSRTPGNSALPGNSLSTARRFGSEPRSGFFSLWRSSAKNRGQRGGYGAGPARALCRGSPVDLSPEPP